MTTAGTERLYIDSSGVARYCQSAKLEIAGAAGSARASSSNKWLWNNKLGTAW